MINILFLGCVYSETQKDLFLKNSHRGYQFAAQNLQESLIAGFVENEANLNVLTIPALSTYPQGYQSPKVGDADYIFKGKKLGKSFGYLNLPLINHANRKKVAAYIDDWYAGTEGKRVIFVYALLEQQMSIAIEAKQRHPDVKLCVIVPDLPRFMGCNKYYKMLGLQDKAICSINANLKQFDSLVVLAEPMVADLGMEEKPYTVVEGIYSGGFEKASEKYKEKVLLYTGGLYHRYGIDDLLEAFHRTSDSDLRLWLCGKGDAVSLIEEYQAKDERIVYKGTVAREEALAYQRAATALVNPRHSNEVFTRFSFPSKTIEYMASGTPCLMCHLESIPQEYDEYLLYFDDETVDGMSRKISEVAGMSAGLLSSLGEKASEFVKNNKTAICQVAKVIDFLEKN